MSALVLDSGAFIAIDRGDRVTAARLRVGQGSGIDLRTTGIVVAQIWRDSDGRQANISRLLKAVEVKAVDEVLGQEAGVLLGRATSNDAVDATVVAVAVSGDAILTSDPNDIRLLVGASERSIKVLAC